MAQTNVPAVAANSTRLSRIFWMAIFSISIVLLGFRIYLAITNGQSSTNITVIQVIIVLFLIYVLFILEGLIVSAIQIKRLDPEALEAHIAREYRESAPKIRTTIATLKNYFPDFMVGRQMCVILTVVALAFTIDGLAFDEKQAPFAWLEAHRQGTGAMAFAFFQFWGTTFLISTLLPCWIGQLLPQFLAEERGVEFVKLPLTKTLTWLSLGISRLGAGAPSHSFFNLIRWITGRFSSEEKIGVGAAQVFETQSSFLGFGVRERVINIEAAPTETKIDDSSVYEFVSGSITHLRHFLKINLPKDGAHAQADPEVKATFTLPSGVRGSSPKTTAVQVVTTQLTGQGATLSQKTLTQSVIVSSQTTVDKTLPRKGSRDEVTVKTSYKWPVLHTENSAVDSFVFDISGPTRQIRFDITPAPDTFIAQPTLRFIYADELPFGEGGRELSGVAVSTEQNSSGWRLTARFPPAGSCAVLELNARVPEAAPIVAMPASPQAAATSGASG